ncbi:uncharacterized protein BT62DRAFT_930211 [Guyanagaster necrorhizus]|uniref:Uncharacterized protein n=1 Tax=Guyanagaster necrorhizus TaxID=856835 RepID=A0A9P8AUJ7_9AGAR|nr:uncharacterized protein BT62DRAFT_930211 [Guyanagaster necrorhizus MCA 3950]KAG7448131.1 hypothetical protein BT62DRAFT_930211 [Guyanagaster necrorhizus MCA 3950]
MSAATPTVLPRDPRFPHLLPSVPRIRPMPLRTVGYEYRDLQHELEELVRTYSGCVRASDSVVGQQHLGQDAARGETRGAYAFRRRRFVL